MSSSSRKTRDDDGINGTVLIKVVLVHDNVVFGGGRSRYGAHVVSSEARKTREENERVVVVSDQERKRRLKYD